MGFKINTSFGIVSALAAGFFFQGEVFSQELPVKPSKDKPAILLSLGSEKQNSKDPALVVCSNGIVSLQEADSTTSSKDEVNILKKGFGRSAATFRFNLPDGHPSGEFTFWAHWKQGGDPNVCQQKFEVWAGADETKLDLRNSQNLKSNGWNYIWADGKTLTIKPEDKIVEVRNSGNAHDAKIFNSFLLAGPRPPEPLPISATKEKPVLVLGFGKEPLRKHGDEPNVFALAGKIISAEGAESSNIGASDANIMKKGFGSWGAVFQFDLQQDVPAGFYNFNAKYKSGGEVSQVRQSFVVKAGPDEQNLGERGVFQTVNRNPWNYQWVKGHGTFAIFPGDKVVQIVNSGKADGAKIFNAFVLGMENPLPAWMSSEQGMLRSKFLSMGKNVEKSDKILYLLDGKGEGDKILFEGLCQDSQKSWYESTPIRYLLGAEAESMSRDLNLPGLPSALIVDSDRKVLGVLNRPESIEKVMQFMSDPSKGGLIPSYPELKQPEPAVLVDGSPKQWLVATGWPGHCGVGHWGVDAESYQRPNPGDLYAYGYYTMGNRTGRWEERQTGENGVCKITEKLAESFAWGKCTSYAVVYLHASEDIKAVLHFQHSGIESAVFLDGTDIPLQADSSPSYTLPRQNKAEGQQVIKRNDNEIHDDVVIPQSAQTPLMANLNISKGSHCLILKLVHAQNQGETVLFTGKLTGADGSQLPGIRTQVCDPTAVLGIAKAAAGLWPSLTMENIPGNLPRPGEQLTLVADMRVIKSFIAGWLPKVFLPINATLRVTMKDYNGKEIKTFEAKGIFPNIIRMDLGKAPSAGYYSLTPSLYTADGRFIHRFHPDGFSVVLGNSAQKERLEKKELWNSWYYALNDQWDTFAPWLERTGLLKNQGSFPGTPKEETLAKWEDAKKRGITLVGDFAGDSNWMNNSEKDAQGIVDILPKYTRYFKSVNEIDGRTNDEEWNPTTNPEQWVKRAKWQYEALHKARPDTIFFSGSLYCSAVHRKKEKTLGPYDWFKKCLELGFDNYIDAWDVHAYPQFAPRLEAASVSNSQNETDLGVLKVMSELGKKNTKPFMLGETSAMVWHGFAGMRWQAATVAKMAAWTNSREDWMGIAFCAAHHNRRITAEEYGMSHNPGEAAIYTAGALIDGFPYRRLTTEDKEIQAAYFGDTFMIWRADDKTSDWKMKLEGAGPWVIVDVVGQAKPLEVKDGEAKFQIGTSPVYILTRENYEKLTK